MLNAIIIDDKPANIETLKSLIDTYCPQLSIVGTATNIEEGSSSIIRLNPSIVFLDIEMPEGNGFDLLKRFNPAPFAVIFTTAYNQYAVQAFRENALDYLLKPIDIEALQESVAKAEKHIYLEQTGKNLEKYMRQLQVPDTSKIALPTQEGYLFVDHTNVIHCEASGSYTHIYLQEGKKILVSMRLKECEDILPAKSFFRVHHSHIIGLRHISKYIRGRGGYLVMQDGSKVEVSASRKDEFLELVKYHY
ncbi:MAG: response regulator transcription factor [Bacteroidetes bacterium]|nr:MAG: response regulator transcription factor [Bacteroidota bacterium]